MAIGELLVVGLVAVLIIAGLTAIVGGFHHAARERQLTHLERIRALELGMRAPDDATTAQIKALKDAAAEPTTDNSRAGLARQCYSTTFWVALWGFVLAGGQSLSGIEHGVAYAIASAAGAIGVTGMVCGTVLAATATGTGATGPEKPTSEADAFDVVSCRG